MHSWENTVGDGYIFVHLARKMSFSEIDRLEHSQLQMNMCFEHGITRVFYW